MADYKKAIAKVLLNEGGYVNDPDDAGGETYKGISRVYWPKWSGWAIIDICKKDGKNFPKNCYTNPTLSDLVTGFYKLNFWDKVGGDGIRDQSIADILVDAAVLEGTAAGIKRAQEIVGLAMTGIVSQDLVTKLNSLV